MANKWSVGQPVVVIEGKKVLSLVVQKVGRKYVHVGRDAMGHPDAKFDITKETPYDATGWGETKHLYTTDEYQLYLRSLKALTVIRQFAERYNFNVVRLTEDNIAVLEQASAALASVDKVND